MWSDLWEVWRACVADESLGETLFNSLGLTLRSPAAPLQQVKTDKLFLHISKCVSLPILDVSVKIVAGYYSDSTLQLSCNMWNRKSWKECRMGPLRQDQFSIAQCGYSILKLDISKLIKSKCLVFAQFWSKSGNFSSDWWTTVQILNKKYLHHIFDKNVVSIGNKLVPGVS